MLPSSEEGAVLNVVWSQPNSFRELRNANTRHALKATCRVRNCFLHPIIACDVKSKIGKYELYTPLGSQKLAKIKIGLYVVINMASVQETCDANVWTGFSWLEID
jgi:hypothetical protein